MDTTTWTDPGSIIGAVGGAIALGGAYIAWSSARVAKASAREAATISRLGTDQRHDQLSPGLPGQIAAVVEKGQHTGESLFGEITVPRDYRVHALAWTGTSHTPIAGLPLLLTANHPHRFHIEHWPPGREEPQTREVRFRFWPPVADLDDTDAWTCPCGRPTGEDTNGPGHWEARVQVVYNRPPVLW